MRIFSWSVKIVVLVLLVSCASMNTGSEAPRISKEEVKAKLGSPNVILLDVRTGNDWDNSGEKIVGAVRMNPKEVDAWSETLVKGKEIILYCSWNNEGTSARVAQQLRAKGFDAKALKGGWREWSEAKYPVEKK